MRPISALPHSRRKKRARQGEGWGANGRIRVKAGKREVAGSQESMRRAREGMRRRGRSCGQIGAMRGACVRRRKREGGTNISSSQKGWGEEKGSMWHHQTVSPHPIRAMWILGRRRVGKSDRAGQTVSQFHPLSCSNRCSRRLAVLLQFLVLHSAPGCLSRRVSICPRTFPKANASTPGKSGRFRGSRRQGDLTVENVFFRDDLRRASPAHARYV